MYFLTVAYYPLKYAEVTKKGGVKCIGQNVTQTREFLKA